MKIFKIELKRAFISKRFLIALAIGVILSILESVTAISKHFTDLKYEAMYDLYTKMAFTQDNSLYSWICGNMYNVQQYIYFIILPFIAVLPHGASLFQDRKNGFYKIVVPKCGKKKYFMAKFVSVFLSGGAAFVLPLIFNLMTTMMFVPTVLPEVTTSIYAVWTRTMLGDLFFSNPAIYITTFLITDFIAAGLFATLAIPISYLTEYQFVVELMPLLFYIFLFSLFGLFDAYEYQLNYAINAAYSRSDGVITYAELMVVALVTITFCIVKGRTDEVM